MKILLTGAAGFIGMHTVKKLATENPSSQILGIDNLNNYYDIQLKKDRLHQLSNLKNFSFQKFSLLEKEKLTNVFHEFNPTHVIHLAAQAGVRYSLENPDEYINSNVSGFLNILECCRNYPVKHLVYASSSSVYGGNTKLPFSEHDNVDNPVSLYAATKKANELMAHSYSELFKIPSTGLRFFTVYGPWGRPDMALFIFTNKILKGETIDVYNYGNMFRDFTHIKDITNGICSILINPPWIEDNSNKNKSKKIKAPYQVFNIGNNQPVKLTEFISYIEEALGVKAKINLCEIQPGDVEKTYADLNLIHQAVGYEPSQNIKYGIKEFVNWYKEYYGS